MIRVGHEPEGMLLRRADVFAWLPGLTREQWKKIQPQLRTIYVPGGRRPSYRGQRPHYPREEIRRKLVRPIMETQHIS